MFKKITLSPKLQKNTIYFLETVIMFSYKIPSVISCIGFGSENVSIRSRICLELLVMSEDQTVQLNHLFMAN